MDHVTSHSLQNQDPHPSGEQILLFVDGELPPREATLLQAHLAQCWSCRAHKSRIESSIADFMGFDAAVLGPQSPPPGDWRGFDRRLASVVEASGSPTIWARLRGWGRMPALRRVALAAGVAALLPVVWRLALPHTTVSADSILNQAQMRERAWLYQPNRILRWVVEEDITGNLNGLPDGHYRTLRWRNNLAGQTAELIRRYDGAGKLVWARWNRPDGSEVVYSALHGESVKVYPSIATVRQYAAQFEPTAQAALEAYAARRERETNLESAYQGALDTYRIFRERGGLRELVTQADGRIFRLHAEGRNGVFTLEEDISAVTFRRIRKGTVRHLPDGRVAREEARTMTYGETTAGDFKANDLSGVLAGTANVQEISPAELLRTRGSR